MNLPVIPDLPIPPLPIEIPLLLHPVAAHFAIAIPIVILLLELVNIFLKRRAISITSLLLIVLAMIIFVGLFLTGKKDGSEGYSLLNEVAQADFKEHKLLGLYLIYATAGIFVLKLLSMLKIGFFKFLFIVALIGFVGVNLLQGKKGGNLVYHHGMNNAAVKDAKSEITYLKDDASDLEDEISGLEDELAELKEKLTCKEVQESVDAVLAEGDVVDVDLNTQEEASTPTKEETAAVEESEATQAVESIVEKVSDSVESNVSAVE